MHGGGRGPPIRMCGSWIRVRRRELGRRGLLKNDPESKEELNGVEGDVVGEIMPDSEDKGGVVYPKGAIAGVKVDATVAAAGVEYIVKPGGGKRERPPILMRGGWIRVRRRELGRGGLLRNDPESEEEQYSSSSSLTLTLMQMLDCFLGFYFFGCTWFIEIRGSDLHEAWR